MAKIIDIAFKPEEEDFRQCQEEFNLIGKEALFLSHYDLAEQTSIDQPILWKQFLTDPRVSVFITEELDMLKKSKVAIMLNTVDTNRNTGQAQLLNTLLNQTKDNDKKEGPVFIYTQVPLNEQERHAKNVVIYNATKSDKITE